MTDTPVALDFASLPRYQLRKFVPDEAVLTDIEIVTGLYERLAAREVDSAEALEAWLLDRSELDAAVSQAGSMLYIRMTCQTDDIARADAYKEFVQTVSPAVRTLSDTLDRKYLAARDQFALDEARYSVHDRELRADVELFRAENVPLQTEVTLLSQRYQEITGAMTVVFDGAERTLQEMAKFLHRPDRSVREAAWRATAERVGQDTDAVEDLFEKLLALRHQVAVNAGCAGVCEYQFRAKHRFDYSPADCFAYHDAVEKVVVPLWRRMLTQRRERMGLQTLRPWDTVVDVRGRDPLQPFATVAELTAAVAGVFAKLDGELAGHFAGMASKGLLDLASRKGKAPGGYQSSLSEARLPFIFMNAVGLDRDVRVLLHESGHAFHSMAAVDEPLLSYRQAPMEFCEVASMSMELLGDAHLDAIYSPADLARSRWDQFESTIHILTWVATIDAFQHWLYAHPDHSRHERLTAWLDVFDRFGGAVIDWTGLEAEKAVRWHRQLHIFEYPFYYIEYGIAQLGALQVWTRAQADPAAALADYRKALALGGSRPLGELFTAAGIRFDFSEATIAPLMEAVTQQLDRIEALG